MQGEVWELLAGSAEQKSPVSLSTSPGLQEARAAEKAPAAAAESARPAERPADSAESAKTAEPAKAAPFRSRASVSRVIPAEITQDAGLNAAIAAGLPRTHDFEIHRSIWKLRRAGARHVGLQLPEGLQGWATALADILCNFAPSVQTATIFGDVTFGACCIDDLGASALGVDFLIHYGHSCIVPTDQTTVTTLYIHVEVEVNVDHLVDTVLHNFSPEKRLAFMSSVQFSSGMMQAVERLRKEEDGARPSAPQVKPLGVGETLGCTSPHAGDVDAVIFVCDGRFHLESAMIQNPHLRGNFFRYDPACLTLTREGFAHAELHKSRKAAIAAAKDAKSVGLVLGTLGRQGSVGVLEEIERLLERLDVTYFTILLSEISPERLALMPNVDAWVQVACPRLSMDWGSSYSKPMLTPYEAHVAFGKLHASGAVSLDWANRIPGIGYEIARGLARRLPEGSTVVITARSPEMGKQAVETLAVEMGDRAKIQFHQLDIGDAKSVEALAQYASSLGGIDVLVNNAGLAFPMNDPTPFPEQARQTVNVNYYGTKRMLTILRPHLKPKSRSVGVSSATGQLGSSWSDALKQRLLSETLSLQELDAIAEEFVAAAADGRHQELGFPGSAYGTSKALMTQLHRVLANTSSPPALLCSVCPGLCRTYMATGRGTFMSNVLWLASFVVGNSAEGGADTPLYLCTELPEAMGF
ncbi:unnamed protein product [Effrenium voratum]|nr:unnamed protein product [Effrenium voratum]